MYCIYSRSSSTHLLPSFCVLFINNDLLANSKFLMITISSHIVCNLIGSTVCVESCSSLLTLQRALLLASSLREKEVHVHINVHVHITGIIPFSLISLSCESSNIRYILFNSLSTLVLLVPANSLIAL